MTRRVLAYACASTDSRVESPELQESTIARRVQQLHRTVDGVWVDAARDEDKALRDRQAGGHLAATWRRGDCVVVARVDRLARSFAEFARLLDDLGRVGVTLCFADSGRTINPASADCTALVDIFAKLAASERRSRQARAKSSIAGLRAKGQRFTGIAPYGFQWQRRGRRTVMVSVPHEQRIAMRVAELQAQGYSLDQIRQYLAFEWRVRNRRGNEFGLTEVRKMRITGAELLRAASQQPVA